MTKGHYMRTILLLTIGLIGFLPIQAKAADVQVHASVRMIAATPMAQTSDFTTNEAIKINASYSIEDTKVKADLGLMTAKVSIGAQKDDLVHVSCAQTGNYTLENNTTLSLSETKFTNGSSGSELNSCDGVNTTSAILDYAGGGSKTLFFGADVDIKKDAADSLNVATPTTMQNSVIVRVTYE